LAEKFRARLVVSVIISFAVFGGAVYSLRYTKKPLFGFLFFFLNIFPLIILLPIGASIAGDRYMYVPAIGLFYIAGEFFCRLIRPALKNKILNRTAVAVMAVIIAIFSVMTWKRCFVWKDSIALWTDVLAKYPDAAFAHNNIASAYVDKGEQKRGEYHYERLLELTPFSESAHYNLGTLYAKTGRIRDGIFHLERAVELKPDYAPALNNLGNAHLGSGDKAKAIMYYRKAIEADPSYIPARENIRKTSGK